MIGTFMPKHDMRAGRYIGPATGLKGCTALISDEGDFWSVQVNSHPEGLMMYGWWKCLKEDWELCNDIDWELVND